MTRIKPNVTLPLKAPTRDLRPGNADDTATQTSKTELNNFKSVKPDEMIANPNHAKKDPGSLVLGPFQKFPMQPEYPAHALEYAKDIRLEHVKKDRSVLLLTDRVFPQLWLKYARDQDQEKRIEYRRHVVRENQQIHDEHMLELEKRSRAYFFQTVYEIVKKRETTHTKLRLLQRATAQHLRAETMAAGKAESQKTQKLIEEGFKKHAAMLAWRLDDLYILLGNNSVVHTKGKGFKLEHEIGRLCWALRRAATGKTHEWRNDNLYTTLPNGGVVHVHRSGGDQREKAEAEIHAPIARKRSHEFLVWREGISTITTPNHGMIQVRNQGHMPEATAAMLEKPKIDARLQKNLEWRRTQLLITEPNGGFVHATSQNFGQAPEVVTGDIAWRHKHHVSCKTWDWRLSNLATITGNGGIAPQKGHHGHTIEHLFAEAEMPHKQEVLKGFEQWHLSHMYAKTPNNGIAPLKGHGQSIEATSAAATDAPRRTSKDRVNLWHAMHMYKQTPNHGWAPLKNVGHSIESVSASMTDRIKNHVTEEMSERRLGDMYVATSNHGWRRIGREGRATEHVAAQVARPSEGIGARENVAAAGGHVLASAELHTVHAQKSKTHTRLSGFQRVLEAEAKTESLLTAHVKPHHPGQSEAAPPEASQIKPKRPRDVDS